MDELKANYKSKNIVIVSDRLSYYIVPKIFFILSNYVTHYNIQIYNDCIKKNLVIPNGIKYINMQIILYYHFVTTNNIKCVVRNYKNEIVYEYFPKINSYKKYNRCCNTKNIIFLHSFYNKYDMKLKNIFLFENLHYFVWYHDNIKSYNSKNVVVFKNVKKIILIELSSYHIKNIMMFRNIYSACFDGCNKINKNRMHNVMDLVGLINNYFVLKKNKSVINNILTITFFSYLR